MPQPATEQSGHFHAVKFYKDPASLASIVCGFIFEGLQRGEPAVLVTTVEHSKYFRECFQASGLDIDAAVASRMLTILDAEETLGKFMRDGVPMADPFNATMLPVFQGVSASYPDVNIRAYGEMVDVLWKKGQTAAAIRLETLWNDLARCHRFGLLCGYAMGSFYKGSSASDICMLHSHVVTDEGTHVPVN